MPYCRQTVPSQHSNTKIISITYQAQNVRIEFMKCSRLKTLVQHVKRKKSVRIPCCSSLRYNYPNSESHRTSWTVRHLLIVCEFFSTKIISLYIVHIDYKLTILVSLCTCSHYEYVSMFILKSWSRGEFIRDELLRKTVRWVGVPVKYMELCIIQHRINIQKYYT